MKMHEISLKNKLEKDLGVEGIMMKKDSADSPNYALIFPVPEREVAEISDVEKAIEDFYSREGFEISSFGERKAAINRNNEEGYLVEITKKENYEIRIAKTDKPELFYNKE